MVSLCQQSIPRPEDQSNIPLCMLTIVVADKFCVQQLFSNKYGCDIKRGNELVDSSRQSCFPFSDEELVQSATSLTDEGHPPSSHDPLPSDIRPCQLSGAGNPGISLGLFVGQG